MEANRSKIPLREYLDTKEFFFKKKFSFFSYQAFDWLFDFVVILLYFVRAWIVQLHADYIDQNDRMMMFVMFVDVDLIDDVHHRHYFQTMNYDRTYPMFVNQQHWLVYDLKNVIVIDYDH